jgi:cytochrome P450
LATEIARAFRGNALDIFPPEAFEEEFVARRFLGRPQVILNRPAAIQRVLIDNPGNYARTRATIRILGPVLGNGLLLSEGEEWRRQRRTVAPALAPRTMPVLAAHVARAAEKAVAGLGAAAEEPTDLLSAMQSLALEVAGVSMFSLEMAEYGPRLRRLIRHYAARLGRPSLLDFLLPLWLPTPRDVGRRLFRRRWHALIGEIVAGRRGRVAPPEAPRDLFDLLALACDPESGCPFSSAALVDQVATLILAGHETTAVALFWSLYLLAERPEWQERLAAEAMPLALGPGDAAEALYRLVEARAVVQEALRLYPPAFTLARQALAEDDAGGIAIAAGTVVLIAPWVLHRHRRLWPEPERFDPARFLPDAPAPDRFAYLPFGIGPRVCVGAHFALSEATLVLGYLMRSFRIALMPGESARPVGVVTTQPDHPPLFRLSRR